MFIDDLLFLLAIEYVCTKLFLLSMNIKKIIFDIIFLQNERFERYDCYDFIIGRRYVLRPGQPPLEPLLGLVSNV